MALLGIIIYIIFILHSTWRHLKGHDVLTVAESTEISSRLVEEGLGRVHRDVEVCT